MMLITKIINEFYDVVKNTGSHDVYEKMHRVAGKYTTNQNVEALSRLSTIEFKRARFAEAKLENANQKIKELEETIEELNENINGGKNG